ncbi:hypothetical protein I4Q36_05635 [Tuanshanicoccus lijuaniae]|uniref:hypothetical protein n=1 Tax=Aerococcaceae bacterium zg-1292 TaxID=2774330 RepID=UPI0019388BDE|nr:hypothetical protein [Aerococcaceae bacterium zg-1292]QQA36308.1 hypothetical protein I4Q36_05635 [Aerococcaceae bacterium zg-1292]
MDYNKEILIVESETNEPLNNDNEGLGVQYKKNRNAYVQGLIMSLILLFITTKNTMNRVTLLESVLLLIALILVIWIGY